MIELVSAGRRSWRRDYIQKRDEYLGLGIKEYWIFNRFQRTLTVYKKSKGRLTEQVVRAKDVYRTDILPGFELPLGQILAIADEWREDSEGSDAR